MSITAWIIFYLIDAIFWLWVVRWGGAEWLEGTLASGFLINIFAPKWSSDGIKLYGYGILGISTVAFIAGLFMPEVRYFC